MVRRNIHISDIGRIVTGKTPQTAIPENYGRDLPFLTPSDDLSQKSAHKTLKTLTAQGLEEVKNCLLPPKSVCVSCIGSVYYLWKHLYQLGVMFMYENGSSGIKNFNIKEFLNRNEIPVPPIEFLKKI